MNIRLYDGDTYLGTFNELSADMEAKRLGGRVKILRTNPSHKKGVVYRDPTTAVRRTNDTPVRVVYGTQILGVMTWEKAKALAKVNKTTIRLTSADSVPQTFTLKGVSSSPLKKG